MRRNRILHVSLAAFALLMLSPPTHGIASAQAPAPGAPVDATAGLSRQVTLTPAEQLAQGDASIARMEASRSGVRRMLEASRAQRDVVKTLCLNDKLNQIDIAIRSARERRGGLELAASRNDADLASHEFTILAVLRQRSEQLSAEANQCIGQEAAFVGESKITTTIDPGMPEEDPAGFPRIDVIVEPPACASCFM